MTTLKLLAKGSFLPVPTDDGSDSAGGKQPTGCSAVLVVPVAFGLAGCSRDQPKHRSAIKHPALSRHSPPPRHTQPGAAAGRALVGAFQRRHAPTAARLRGKAAVEKRAIPAPRLKLSLKLPRSEIQLRRVPPSPLPIQTNPAAPPSTRLPLNDPSRWQEDVQFAL